MPQTIVPVILSGGSGTRLWPLSLPERPKQLLPLVSGHTMLQDTLLRLAGLGERVDDPIVICNAAHGEQVAKQLGEINVTPEAIVLEPTGRNTAPAIAVAALLARQAQKADADPVLLVLPADHMIDDEARFCGAVEIGLGAAAAGKLVTFGVVPSRLETGYGYIRAGNSDHGGWRTVAEFVEKPDAAKAQRYIQSGNYFWNSGMFIFGTRAFLSALGEHAPAMLTPCEAAVGSAQREEPFIRIGNEFCSVPADSIDFAIMEKTDDAVVVPLDAGWSDVGSWLAVHEILESDPVGNVFRGNVVAEDCRGCYVHAGSRRVAVIGLERCVVVETGDAVLVMPLDRAQDLKVLVDQMNRPSTHR